MAVLDHSTNIKEFCRYIEGGDSGILLADGLEDAFIGVGTQFRNAPVAVYDYGKCLEILAERFREESGEENAYADAVEWMSVNVCGAWMGEQTPVFMVTYSGGDSPCS